MQQYCRTDCGSLSPHAAVIEVPSACADDDFEIFSRQFLFSTVRTVVCLRDLRIRITVLCIDGQGINTNV